jgi:PAS domain S-box-containing protein
MPESTANSTEIVDRALRDGDLFKLLLDQLGIGIYIVDRDRRILYWSAGAETITGYYAHEMVGRFCQNDLLMHCDESGRVLCGGLCPLKEVMEHGAPHECKLFVRHRNGHRIPVNIRSHAICESGGERVGAVEIFNEATETALPDLTNLAGYGCLDDIGTLKRPYGEMKARQALEALNLFGIPFAWIRIALDDIAGHERRYGPGMVSAAIKMIAATLASSLKTLDWLTYWAAGEFRIEARGYSLGELDELKRSLPMLVHKSTMKWWGDAVRLTASVSVRMAQRGDTLESLESWETAAIVGNSQGEQ